MRRVWFRVVAHCWPRFSSTFSAPTTSLSLRPWSNAVSPRGSHWLPDPTPDRRCLHLGSQSALRMSLSRTPRCEFSRMEGGSFHLCFARQQKESWLLFGLLMLHVKRYCELLPYREHACRCSRTRYIQKRRTSSFICSAPSFPLGSFLLQCYFFL